MHDWSDLPDVTAKLVNRAAKLEAVVEAARSVVDASCENNRTTFSRIGTWHVTALRVAIKALRVLDEGWAGSVCEKCGLYVTGKCFRCHDYRSDAGREPPCTCEPNARSFYCERHKSLGGTGEQ